MTQTTCNHLVELIEKQLHDQFEIEEYDGQCVIFTPMLFPDNSRISVALEATGSEHFLLTDNGEALDYAFAQGVPDHVVQERIRETIRRFHLSDTGSDELVLRVEGLGIPKGIFTLMSAIQDAVSYTHLTLPTILRV